MSRVHIDRTPLVSNDGKTYEVRPEFFRYEGGDIAKRSDITSQEYKGEWYEVGHYVFALDMTVRIMVPASFVENNPSVFELIE